MTSVGCVSSRCSSLSMIDNSDKKGLKMRNLLLFAAVLVTVCLLTPAAVALDHLGRARAGLQRGQWSVGVDYLWEDSAIELDHASPIGLTAPFGMDVEESAISGVIGYGVLRNVELFVRIGLETHGDADGQMTGQRVDFDGESGFFGGAGVRATLYEKGNLAVGAMFQVTRGHSDGDIQMGGLQGDVEGNTTEYSLALAPSYRLTERIAIYGGPFLYFMNGDIDGEVLGTAVSFDLKEDDRFGGFIGSQMELTENVSFHVEWQHTDSADGIGAGLVWAI